jgi:proline racemase
MSLKLKSREQWACERVFDTRNGKCTKISCRVTPTWRHARDMVVEIVDKGADGYMPYVVVKEKGMEKVI